jgi:ATP-dependent protease Clp ATPase subunit
MIIEDLMLDLMYQVPNQKKVREVTITREVVLGQGQTNHAHRESGMSA